MNKELLAKAKVAKTAEELIALAKKNGVELTEGQAKNFFARLNAKNEELSDEELNNVTGGGCRSEQKVNGMIFTEDMFDNPEEL